MYTLLIINDDLETRDDTAKTFIYCQINIEQFGTKKQFGPKKNCCGIIMLLVLANR
jgi:hypothetical protein